MTLTSQDARSGSSYSIIGYLEPHSSRREFHYGTVSKSRVMCWNKGLR